MSNTIEIVKSFSFEAAHRLGKGYPGICKNIHGHSFTGEIQVSTQTLDQYGMAIDFGDIQTFLNEIETHFDHKLIVYKEDSALISLCQDEGWDTVIFEDENPTSERIAKDIFEKATRYFKEKHPNVSVDWVSIAETCTARCIWKKIK